MSAISAAEDVTAQPVTIAGRLTAAHLDELAVCALEAAPREGVAVILDVDGELRVAPLPPGTRSSFAVTNDDLHELVQAANEQATLVSIAGWFHSHPRGRPTPSTTDVTQLRTDVPHLIGAITRATTTVTVRAFYLDRQGLVREAALPASGHRRTPS